MIDYCGVPRIPGSASEKGSIAFGSSFGPSLWGSALRDSRSRSVSAETVTACPPDSDQREGEYAKA
jgi:hypothetical protein